MAEIFQNREQKFQHVGKCIAAHRMRFSYIAGAFERPIAGVQHRNVWLGLKAHVAMSNFKKHVHVALSILRKAHVTCYYLFKFMLDVTNAHVAMSNLTKTPMLSCQF